MVYDYVRRHFKLDLPDCIFRCEAMHKMRSLRCIHVNGFGGEHDITLNAKLLGMTKLDAFLFVLHGALHVWDDCNGTTVECGRHSAAFVSKAAEFGIPTDAGRVCKVMDPSPKIVALAAKRIPDYLSPLRPGFEQPVAEQAARVFAYRCPCRTIVVPREMSLACSACGQPLIPVTEIEFKKYSCDCGTIREIDEVDYICLKCNKPMKLEH
jgi:hypothetical protein